MNCDQARRLLSERLDHPLPPDEAVAVRAHLAGCAECRDFERALVASMAALESLPRSLVSPRVRDGVRSYVAGDGAGGTDGWLRQVGAFAASATVLVAVAALLVVLLHGRTFGANTVASSPVATAIAAATRPSTNAVVVPATPAASTPTITFTVPGTPAPTSTPAATPLPVVVTQATARGTVYAYFEAINRHDYASAYALLWEDISGQSENAFAAGFTTTAHDTVTIVNVTPDDGNMAVSMVLVAAQTDGSVRTFSGRYLVGVKRGEVLIVGADVREDTPPEVATPAATPSALSVCSLSHLTMGLTAQGATGGTALTVTLTNHGAPCQVVGSLRVTIDGQAGDALPVQGNGVVTPLNIAIGGMGASTTEMYAWSNWCGSDQQVAASATLSDLSGVLGQLPAPRCDTPSSPSDLRAVLMATWTGTVVSNTPGTGALTLRFQDGTTRRVVVSDQTVVTDVHGSPVQAAAIQPGAHLSASGAVSSDATEMMAATVVVRP
ncbi:MAG TPA: anti-sigma factor [Thermomicrobiaceae bacterium]|nr:anti-sigma factor [Thermomicrobiaceae bacterium]